MTFEEHVATHKSVAFSESTEHFTNKCQALLNTLSLQFSAFFFIPEKVLSGKRRILTYLSTRSATTGFPEKLVASNEVVTTFLEFA